MIVEAQLVDHLVHCFATRRFFEGKAKEVNTVDKELTDPVYEMGSSNLCSKTCGKSSRFPRRVECISLSCSVRQFAINS